MKNYLKIFIPLIIILIFYIKFIYNKSLFNLKEIDRIDQTIQKTLQELSPYINQYSSELKIKPCIVSGVIYIEMQRQLVNFKGRSERFLNQMKITRELLRIAGATFGIGQLDPKTMKKCILFLNDMNSDFFLGEKYRTYLTNEDFKKAMSGEERITKAGKYEYDFKYPNLQVKFIAVIIAQFQNQWKKAGFDISENPKILGTLYNIGYEKSIPKASPRPGGTKLFINNRFISFGEALALWCESRQF